MTELGLHFSRSANGVSKLHGEVAQDQFPDYKIGHVTNGEHHLTGLVRISAKYSMIAFPDGEKTLIAY